MVNTVAYNTGGRFAHCSGFVFKILRNSQNIYTYYMLHYRIRCMDGTLKSAFS